jgi:hypothetical protein
MMTKLMLRFLCHVVHKNALRWNFGDINPTIKGLPYENSYILESYEIPLIQIDPR